MKAIRKPGLYCDYLLYTAIDSDNALFLNQSDTETNPMT